MDRTCPELDNTEEGYPQKYVSKRERDVSNQFVCVWEGDRSLLLVKF